MHEVDPAPSARLSHALCGSVTNVSASFKHLKRSKVSLNQVLSLLQDHPSREHTNECASEQAVLLTTVIMVTINDTWLQFDMNDAWSIVALLNKQVDGLAFSGKDHLLTLEEEFDRVKVWKKFMVGKAEGPSKVEGEIHQPLDCHVRQLRIAQLERQT